MRATRMPARPTRGRPRIAGGAWFAALAVLSLALLLGSGTEPVRGVQELLRGMLDPARQAVASGVQVVVDAVAAVGEIGQLRTENDELRRRLAGAEQRVAALTEAARENEELRDLLGLSEALDMELLSARVTSRDPSTYAWEVTIDTGTDAGVRAGMPVVGSAEGAGALVGTVVETDERSARVRLVVDDRSSVAAVDQQTRALGELRGHAAGQLLFTNVPVTEPIAVGDAIVSAGIVVGDDASRYPGGLLLGYVEAVVTDANAVTQTAFVRPAIDPEELERVLVVVDFEQG